MSIQKSLNVKSLYLDLKNYRSTPQKNEIEAVKSLIAASPDWFEGLLDSLIDNGYASLENIGILKDNGKSIVLECNRRIAAIKIIHGYIKLDNLRLSPKMRNKLTSVSADWIKNNMKVPCIIFNSTEEPILREIIARTHGTDDRAGRLTWDSISKARNSRDVLKNPEPELDLLEQIFRSGDCHTEDDARNWATKYPYTIYNESITSIVRILNISIYDLRDRYAAGDIPEDTVKLLEQVIADIGNKKITYKEIRDASRRVNKSFYVTYGFHALPETPTIGTPPPSTPPSTGPRVGNAPEIGSIRHCDKILKSLKTGHFKSDGASKLSTLLKELIRTNHDDTPNAFALLMRCFILTGTEIFCQDHNIPLKNGKGEEKNLITLIKDTHNYIVNHPPVNTSIKDWKRELTMSLQVLTDEASLLSTACMNVIQHRRNASANPYSMRIAFANIQAFLNALGF